MNRVYIAILVLIVTSGAGSCVRDGIRGGSIGEHMEKPPEEIREASKQSERTRRKGDGVPMHLIWKILEIAGLITLGGAGAVGVRGARQVYRRVKNMREWEIRNNKNRKNKGSEGNN